MSNNSNMIEIRPGEAQHAYRHCEHDSLQYHFFTEGNFYAARLFLTPSLDHTSMWCYDGQARELFSSTAKIHQCASTHPDVKVDALSLKAEESGGAITLASPGSSIDIKFAVHDAYAWQEPIGTVLHQPNLTCEITHNERKMTGVGYCKRYCWNGAPHHWGYRFFHGAGVEHSDFVWTADATFGTKKYAYFKVLTRGGILLAAAIPDSCHRDDGAYATIDGRRYTLRAESLGEWETRLLSKSMDSLMTQRFCRMTLSDGQESIEGYAVNELCFGTLG